MRDQVRISAKKREAKRESSVTRTPKTDVSHSINSPINQILHLQRTIGNQAVQKLFKSGVIQAKLRIGQPNDIYEQEADRVAEQVMQMPEPQVQRQIEEEEEEEETLQTKPLAEQITPLVQRQVEEEEEEETLQTKEASGQTQEAIPALESRINAMRGGGQPLSESERAFMEPRFGHDFSRVRVHTDVQAAESARAVNALAYTIGRNVVFAAGQYKPSTIEGQRLLAHELTHAIQQGASSVSLPEPLLISSPTDDAEQEASNVAQMGNEQGFSVGVMASPRIQRECRHFDAGWTHPVTGRPGPAGTWCETLDEARAQATACPSDCFVYSDGPASHLYRPIPGFPCAHYVAHELGVREGERHARCMDGYSVTIAQITGSRNAFPLAQAQVNDIWSDGGHSGVVRAVDPARPRVLIEACSIGGAVYRDWEEHGNVYR